MRLEGSLYKFPIGVRFAGLFGTTEDMIRHGWELSLVEAPRSYRHREIYFYGHHKGLDLRCSSALIFVDEYVKFDRMVANFQSPVIIEGVAREITIMSHSLPELKVQHWDGNLGLERGLFENFTSSMSFGPLGQEMKMARSAIDALAKFTSIEDAKDLYVPEKEIMTIQKHLDAIRAIQEPKQREIRKKMLDELERNKKNELQSVSKIYLVS